MSRLSIQLERARIRWLRQHCNWLRARRPRTDAPELCECQRSIQACECARLFGAQR